MQPTNSTIYIQRRNNTARVLLKMILNRSHKLLPLLLSLMVAVASTVVIPAIPTTTENCLSTSTSLSITKYHLYHKVSLSADTVCMQDDDHSAAACKVASSIIVHNFGSCIFLYNSACMQGHIKWHNANTSICPIQKIYNLH